MLVWFPIRNTFLGWIKCILNLNLKGIWLILDSNSIFSFMVNWLYLHCIILIISDEWTLKLNCVVDINLNDLDWIKLNQTVSHITSFEMFVKLLYVTKLNCQYEKHLIIISLVWFCILKQMLLFNSWLACPPYTSISCQLKPVFNNTMFLWSHNNELVPHR